jgi:hypothetical protein
MAAAEKICCGVGATVDQKRAGRCCRFGKEFKNFGLNNKGSETIAESDY